MQIAGQAAQVAGFAAGGALVAATNAQTALGIDASSFLLSAGLIMFRLRQRPAGQTAEQTGSLIRDTKEGFQLVARDPVLRSLLLFALLTSFAIIAPEGLAVPIAHSFGRGALEAGILTAAVPLGFLAASAALLRVETAARIRLLPWLALLSCVPLLATPLAPSLPAVVALWFVGGAGGTANLIASSAFMQACPRPFRARAYGLAGTSLYAVQGGALVLAGALAEPLGPRGSVGATAFLSLVLLTLFVRRSNIRSQGTGDAGR